MKRRDEGIALIDFILFILIVICSAFILIIVLNKDSSFKVSNADIQNETSKNDLIEKYNIIQKDKNEVVELSNNINSGENVVSTENEAKKYYYKQLDSVGKSMYDTLEKNIANLKDGNKNIDFDVKIADAGSYFQSVWDAFMLDRPDVFWIDTLKVSIVTKTTSFLGTVNYSYYLSPAEGYDNYLIDTFKIGNDVEMALIEINNKINEIVNKANGSTYDKVKIVHDEIISMVDYDQNIGINSSNIYGSLVEKLCACEGYAETFKVILDKLNIPCVVVYGNGIDGNGQTEAHAWNYVKMDDGNWYAVDITWDDPIIIGNGSTLGIDRHKYFLKGKTSFEENHQEDGNVSGRGQIFKYPTLSLNNY